MKKTFLGMILVIGWMNGHCDIILTGIMDGTLTGGKPKAIELFISGTEDLGGYELWRSQNGDPFGSGLGSVAALSGIYSNTFVYLVKSDHVVEFHSVFGESGYYANVIPLAIVSGNGNEGYQIRDTVGDVVIDQVWLEDPTDSYRDSYWYRINGTGPDGTWLAAHWGSPGNDALDGLDEAGLRAAVPFGFYSLVWKGISSDWTASNNWMPETVPSLHCNVFIPDTVALFPVVTSPPEGPAECYSLTVAAGASLTVAAGNALTVHGMLQVNGVNTAERFVLDSDSSLAATGSLLLKNPASDSIGIRRYIPTDNSWHFLSSPVSGQRIQPGFAPDPLDNSFDLYCWSNTEPMSQGWMNIRDDNGNLNPLFDTVFLKGKGYLAAYSPQYTGSSVKEFQGVPHLDNMITLMLVSTNDWNLLGNPYTCAMDWSATGNDSSVITGGAMYIWDQALNSGAGAYRAHNGTTGVPAGTTPFIPAMNGYFVHAPGNSMVMFNTQTLPILTHAGQDYYKSTEPGETESIRLRVSKDAYSDEALILFDPAATNGFDPEMDAMKLSNGVDAAPEISMMTENNRRLCISQLSSCPVSVPLNIEYGYNDSLKIAAFDFDGLSPAAEVFLEDLKTGIWRNLREEPEYTFLNEVPGTSQRLVLHFMEATEVREASGSCGLRAYVSGGLIHITGLKEDASDFHLVDMSGRSVSSGKTAGTIAIPTGSPGVYLLVLNSGRRSHRIKIIL